jgi:signal transduction histidine kinase
VRLWPRSFAGQMVLLMALALFVAQAINFVLILNERQARRYNFSVAGAVAATVDAVEAAERGQGFPPPRPRNPHQSVRLTPQSLIAEAAARDLAAESRLASAIADAGLGTLPVRAAAMPVGRAGEWPAQAARGSAERRPPTEVLILSVRMAEGRWLNLRWPLPGSNARLVSSVLIQTLIIFAALLLPVIWLGRQAARPLRKLAAAAASFGPRGASEAVPLEGPADVQRLIATFNEMRTRILDMLGEKDRMLGAIGHDLRTPLASLRLRAENVDDDGERERMVATIDEMSRTLEDILSLARLGRSKEPVARVDLAALADAAVEDLRDLGHDVELEPSAALPIPLRPVMTTRAIRNLIDNAVKYGGRARVRVFQDGCEAVVEVEDEGPGIAEEHLERVMDGFQRLEGSRNRETGGTGIGLTIARSIVREQGGDIRLENRPARGLKASLRLPLEGPGAR